MSAKSKLPAKSKSPEAAQKRIWKAERKDLVRAYTKIMNDATRAVEAAAKKLKAAQREYDREMRRIDSEVPKASKKIERRMAILDGRIGV